MKFSFVDFDEEFGNLQEVTSPRVFYRKKFDPKGIFSEQIFGPLEDFKCQCGFLQGREFAGRQCPKCGVIVGLRKMRSTTFAKIQLPQVTSDYTLKLVNPLAIMAYQKMISKVTKKIKVSLLSVACGHYAAKIDRVGSIVRAEFEEGSIGPNYVETQLVPYIASLNKETSKITDKFRRYLFTTVIPVLPPNTRPINKITGTKSDYQMSGLNMYYMKIIRIINQIQQSPYIFDNVLALLQKEYTNLIDEILKSFSKKKGFLRKYILGKRVDYSGRAVITVDPTLKLNECKIPFTIAKEIYKPTLIKPLAKKLNISEIEVIKHYNDDELQPIILDVVRDMYKGTMAILNRQPTLHRHSIEALNIADITEDDVIKIHPLITDPYNADFDGDQMALYIPHLNKSLKECREKLAPVVNIELPSNRSLAYIPKQDIVLGLSILTEEHYTKKATYLDILTTEGRIEVMKCLPKYAQQDKELFEIINKNLTKKDIEKFLVMAYNKISPSDWIELVNKITRLGIEYGKVTISLQDFDITEEDKVHIRRNEFDKVTENNATKMIKSGARGKWEQYIQTTVEKGLVNDITNDIVGRIDKPLLRGLTPREFFISAYGGRKGLIDSAENTAKAGYFTRKLVFLSSVVTLDPEVDDCGTNRYIEIFVDQRIAPLIKGRYRIDENNNIVKIDNPEELIGQKIKLRSPITCGLKGHKVCRKCYGDIRHNSKMIGMIAAQSLGERATQLTLRTKHISGAGSIIPNDMYKHLSIKHNNVFAKMDGKISTVKQKVVLEFNDGYKCHIGKYGDFISNTTGEFKIGDNIGILKSKDIVSAIKLIEKLLNNPGENISVNDYLNSILDIYGSYASIDLIHFEVILQSMVRDKHDVYKLFKNSNSNEYTIIGLEKAINMYPEQAITFERFKTKIQKFIVEGNIPAIDDRSLLDIVAFFDMDERPIKTREVDN